MLTCGLSLLKTSLAAMEAGAEDEMSLLEPARDHMHSDGGVCLVWLNRASLAAGLRQTSEEAMTLDFVRSLDTRFAEKIHAMMAKQTKKRDTLFCLRFKVKFLPRRHLVDIPQKSRHLNLCYIFIIYCTCTACDCTYTSLIQ